MAVGRGKWRGGGEGTKSECVFDSGSLVHYRLVDGMYATIDGSIVAATDRSTLSTFRRA